MAGQDNLLQSGRVFATVPKETSPVEFAAKEVATVNTATDNMLQYTEIDAGGSWHG